MRVEHSKKMERRAFDSLNEMSHYLADTPRTWESVDAARKEPASDYWDLKAGWQGALDMARDGWLEGAQRFEAVLDKLPVRTPALATRNDFYGHLPHVSRFCAGAPDSMIRYTQVDATAGQGRVVTIYVPINAPAMVSAQYMANFGIGVAQTIVQMESDGYRVELHSATASDVGGYIVADTHCVKNADQPLDLAVLAFAIGHPAMARRLGFGLRECSKAGATRSYGRAIALEAKHLIDPAPGFVVINGMRDAGDIARTPIKAQEYVTKQITKALDNPEAE